jgi:glycosyltransferase involved in cell wall biosynthesis
MLASPDRHRGAELAALDDAAVMVHVASRVTEEVFSFLGPATAALKHQGVTPVLVALDDMAVRTWLKRFDPSVRLVLVHAGPEPLGNFVRLRSATLDVLQRYRRIEGIHLHGVIPHLLGIQAARKLGVRAPMYFSPHASRLLSVSSISRRALSWATDLQARLTPTRPIVSHRVDVDRLSGWHDSAIDLIESPVLSLFLNTPRRPSEAAVIVGGGLPIGYDEALAMFARFAVLLRDTSHQPMFYWIGAASQAQLNVLASVNAQIVPRDNEPLRARLLSQAWIYVAGGHGRGVPVGVTEAMAAGVPCVVADTPSHSEMVRHELSGFIFRTEDEALGAIAQLLDSPNLRDAVGRAARSEAMVRFDGEVFRTRLLEAYRRVPQAEPAVPKLVADPRLPSLTSANNSDTGAWAAAPFHGADYRPTERVGPPRDADAG